MKSWYQEFSGYQDFFSPQSSKITSFNDTKSRIIASALGQARGMANTWTWEQVIGSIETTDVIKPTHWSEANQNGGSQVNGTDFRFGQITYGDHKTYLYIGLPKSKAYYDGVQYLRMDASRLPYFSGFAGNKPDRYGYTDTNGDKNDFYMFVPVNGYYTTERYFHLDIHKVVGKFIWKLLRSETYELTSSTTRYSFKSLHDHSAINAYYLTVNYPTGHRYVTVSANWCTYGVTTGYANWYAMTSMGLIYDMSSGTTQYPVMKPLESGSHRGHGISLTETFGDKWMLKNPFYLPVVNKTGKYLLYITYMAYDE